MNVWACVDWKEHCFWVVKLLLKKNLFKKAPWKHSQDFLLFHSVPYLNEGLTSTRAKEINRKCDDENYRTIYAIIIGYYWLLNFYYQSTSTPFVANGGMDDRGWNLIMQYTHKPHIWIYNQPLLLSRKERLNPEKPSCRRSCFNVCALRRAMSFGNCDYTMGSSK